jgi:hypothetical protein
VLDVGAEAGARGVERATHRCRKLTILVLTLADLERLADEGCILLSVLDQKYTEFKFMLPE